jgi:hypothetical protein
VAADGLGERQESGEAWVVVARRVEQPGNGLASTGLGTAHSQTDGLQGQAAVLGGLAEFSADAGQRISVRVGRLHALSVRKRKRVARKVAERLGKAALSCR